MLYTGAVGLAIVNHYLGRYRDAWENVLDQAMIRMTVATNALLLCTLPLRWARHTSIGASAAFTAAGYGIYHAKLHGKAGVYETRHVLWHMAMHACGVGANLATAAAIRW